MFDMFEHKTALMQLLEMSSRADGVQIFIGGESQLVPLDEMSIVTAPYAVDGRIVGTLGVIGPTRMAYERVIPIVDITARLLSRARCRTATTSRRGCAGCSTRRRHSSPCTGDPPHPTSTAALPRPGCCSPIWVRRMRRRRARCGAMLKQFLADPRVVEIPRVPWWLILNLFILNTRPRKSAAKYRLIWTPGGFAAQGAQHGAPGQVPARFPAQARRRQHRGGGRDALWQSGPCRGAR